MKKLTRILITIFIASISVNTFATTLQSSFPKTFELEQQAIEYTTTYNADKTFNDMRAFNIPVYKQVKGETKVYYRSLIPTDEQLNKELENLYLYVVNKDAQMAMHKLALEYLDTQSLVMHLADNKCGMAHDVYNARYKISNPVKLDTENICRQGMKIKTIPEKEYIDGKKLDLQVDKKTKTLSTHKKSTPLSKAMGSNAI